MKEQKNQRASHGWTKKRYKIKEMVASETRQKARRVNLRACPPVADLPISPPGKFYTKIRRNHSHCK
jgi:hypothetical protein